MNESTLKILSQAARNAAREVGLEEDFDQHSAIAGYTNPNATIQVKKKRGSSTAVGGKPNLPGLPAPAQEESTQPVSAASALAGMQRGTDAKSVLAELLASGDTLAYGAAKQEFDAMEAAKKEKQQKAAQNPYGGAQALQNALSIKAEALNRRAESIADFQAKLEKRIADFNAGRGTDTQEQLNREIAALTLRKDVYNRDLAAYEKEYAQMSGIIREGVQAVDAQIAKAQRDVEVYFSDAHGEMLDRQIQDAYERQAAQAAAERDGTSLPNSRSASELWDEYLAAQDRYSQWETEKAEYSLSILPNAERQLLDRYVEAKNNQSSSAGQGVSGGYYGGEEVESRRKAVVDHFGKERAEQLIQMAERSYNAKRQQEENRKMAEYAQRGVGEAIVASVASIVTNALSAPGVLVSTLAQKLHNPNNLRTLDTNTAGFSMQNATRSLLGGVESAIMPDEENATAGQKAGVMLYSTLMSGLNSLVASFLPGKAGGVLLGATAATNTIQDVTERGGTMNQAITAGVVSGVFECLFEDVSIGKFKALQEKSNVRSAVDFLQNVGKSIGVNASEEAATELANILYDSVALGDISNYEIRLRELMEDEDMDERKAKQTLAGELAMQVMESAVSGALMGGVFGVLGSTTAAGNTKRNDLITNTLMLDGLIDQGLSYPGTEIFDIAAQMQELRNAGKMVPSEEIMALAEKIQNQIIRQKAQGAGMAEATNARATEDMLGLSESVQKIAAAIPQQVETGAAEVEAQIETELARNAVQETEGEDMNVRTTEEVQETETQAVPAREEVRLETVAPAVKEAVRTESDAGNISALPTVENAAQVNTEENTTLSEAEAIVAELAETHTGPGLASIVGETVRRLNARGSTTLAQEVNRAYNSFIKNGGSFNGERREASRLSVSEGSERSADQSAVGEGVGVPGGTESRAYGRRTGEGEGTGTQNLREVLRGNEVRNVSSAELMGNSDTFRYATDDTVSVIDEQSEEGKKYASVYKTIRQSGSEPVLISGRVQYTGKDGRVHYSEGLSTADGRIIVSVDGETAPEKIARHEVFHQTMRKIDKVRRDMAEQRMVRELKRKYSDAEIMEMLEEYTLRYAPIYGNNDSMIYQEFLADAYAGLNRFDRDITKYQRDVVGMTAQERSAQEAEAKRNRQKQKTTRSDTSADDADPTLADRTQKEVNQEISKAMDDALNVMTRIEGEDGTMMSVTSMREDMESGELGRILDKCVSIGAISSNDRTELVKMVDRVIGTIMKNSDILDFGQNITKNERAFLPVKPNSDALYGVSVEFSTVCRKRVLQQVLQERLEEKYQTVITKEERIAIRDALLTLRKEGKKIEVACALCYVEAARLNAPGQIQKWLDDRAGGMSYYFALKNKSFNNGYVKQARVKAVDEAIRDGLAKGEKWENLSGSMPKSKLPQKLQNIGNEAAQSARYDYEPTAEEQKVIDAVREMPNEMFTTQDGLWELKNNYPQVFDAFSSSVRAATHSKMVEGDTPWYMGDSKKISDSLIRRRNKENGVRSQSWSDFQTIHILDYMAMVIEMASRNAKMHAYTKVADYIMLMGETGTMINGSLIPKSFNGKDLEWDPIEGIDYNVLSLLRDRYPDTVGNCAIGIDDKQIRMMLESNLIDYIIPYHRSGLSADARMRMHIEDWGEYQDKQTEKKADDSKKAGKKPIFSEWFHVEQAKAAAEKYNAENPEEYKKDVMYGAKRAMDDQAQNYIRLCESRNLSPKFEDFAGESGYWKLLIDRKMINQKTGEIIEQKAVTPKFNEDNIMEILSRTVADYAESNPDEQEAIEMVSRMWSDGKIQEMAADPRRVKAVMDVEVQGLAIAAKAATSEEYDTYMSEADAPRGTDYDDRGERWTGEFREVGGRNAKQDITVEPAEATEERDEIRRIIEDGDIPPETVSEAKAVAVGDKSFSEADIPAAVDLFDFEQLVSQFMTARDLGFDQIMRDYGIELDDTPQKPKKTRVSKFRSNTLAEIYGEDADRYFKTDDFSYLPISEQESLREAQRRLSTDAAGVIEKLRQYDSWGSADMDAAYAVLGILRHAAGVTGQKADIDALNEWARLMRSQNTKAGQMIQANAKYSRNPLTLVLKASEFMDMMTERERSKLDTIEQYESAVQAKEEADASGVVENVEAAEKDLKHAAGQVRRIPKMARKINRDGTPKPGAIADAKNILNERIKKVNGITEQAILNTNDMVNAIEAVVDGDRDALIDVILRTAAIRKNKLSRRMVRNLRQESKTGMDFDTLKTLAMKQIENIAMDYQNRSVGEKVSVFQTLAQLLNLRTGMRNFTSNQIFDIVATTANNIGVIPDLLLSMVTGTRTVGVDFSWGSSAKRRGAAQGWRRAAIEVALDVDSGTSKYGTAKRRTWNMQTSNTLGKGMSQFEKVMGYELNVTDEFLKESVRQETLRGLMKFVDRGTISLEEAQEMAEQEALYRSFQDDTLPGRILSGIKNALNNVGFSKKSENGLIYTWGLGDLVQKYTQVPGALISRAVEFSPLGYLKAVHSLLTIRQDGKVSPEKQRAASLAIGRATTGTGMIVAFAALAVKGILKRRDDEENKDIAALSDSEGIYGSQINLSALSRLIRGEDTKWRKGDVLIDVDFMEPINALMSIGTAVAKGESNLGEMIGESINALYRSIMETPTLETLQSFQDAIEYYDEEKDGPRAVSLLMTLMESSVTGFVPSIIRQVAQATDYAYRDQYTSQNQFTQLWDRIKNTLPGARQTLPEKLDNFGDVKDYEEPLINALNSLVMPGGIYVYERGEVSEELARVREATGKDNIYPSRYAPYSMKIGDETVDLTPEQREAYQKTRGTMTSTLMVELMASDVYQNLTDAERAEMLAKIVGIGNDTAKQELYEDLGKTYKTKTYDKYYDLVSSGMSSSEALDIMYRDGLIEPDYVNGEKVPGSEMLKSLDLIDSYGFEEDAYVEAAYQFLSDTRGEDFQIMLDAGLTTDDVSMVFREYMRLNNEDMSGAERATEFAYYVDSLGLNSNARATVLDTLKYSSGFTAKAETYEKYQAAGLSSESAKKVYDILGGLTSEDGKEASAAQKYRAFVDSDLTKSEKIAAIGVVMGTDMLTEDGNPSSYAKFKTMLDDGVSLDDYVSIYEAGMVDAYPKLRTAKKNGVSYDTYISFFGNFAAIDADGNGSLRQSEVVNALNDRPDLTNEEKAVLWQLAAIKWSAKNNPYNTRISAKVQDAVTSYKW